MVWYEPYAVGCDKSVLCGVLECLPVPFALIGVRSSDITHTALSAFGYARVFLRTSLCLARADALPPCCTALREQVVGAWKRSCHREWLARRGRRLSCALGPALLKLYLPRPKATIPHLKATAPRSYCAGWSHRVAEPPYSLKNAGLGTDPPSLTLLIRLCLFHTYTYRRLAKRAHV